MNIKLNKIMCHGENNSVIYISIKVNYGWEGEMHNDTIQINYNSQRQESFLTVKIKNYGVSQIADKILECITKIDIKNIDPKIYPTKVIEALSNSYEMEYNEETIKEGMSKFKDVT